MLTYKMSCNKTLGIDGRWICSLWEEKKSLLFQSRYITYDMTENVASSENAQINHMISYQIQKKHTYTKGNIFTKVYFYDVSFRCRGDLVTLASELNSCHFFEYILISYLQYAQYNMTAVSHWDI